MSLFAFWVWFVFLLSKRSSLGNAEEPYTDAILPTCRKFWTFMWKIILKKSTFFWKVFCLKQWKINFWKRKWDFKNTFLNLNLFDLIVVKFCKFRWYERSELQVHILPSDYTKSHKNISSSIAVSTRTVWWGSFLTGVNAWLIIFCSQENNSYESPD